MSQDSREKFGVKSQMRGRGGGCNYKATWFLKMVALIYFIVSEINILIKFR